MFRIIIFLLALGCAPGLQAQSLDAFKEHLAAPVPSTTSGSAQVTITEYGDAARAVASASQNNPRLRLKGYRVCIFFDNGQDARAKANAAMAQFESAFPGVKAYLFYENPYFKVTAGNCVTAEEAIILMERLRGTFPKAFLKSEDLSVSDFVR